MRIGALVWGGTDGGKASGGHGPVSGSGGGGGMWRLRKKGLHCTLSSLALVAFPVTGARGPLVCASLVGDPNLIIGGLILASYFKDAPKRSWKKMAKIEANPLSSK